MRTRGVDVAPKTLYRMLQAERGAASGEKDGVNGLYQKPGRERMCEAIAHTQLDTSSLARSNNRERVVYA